MFAALGRFAYRRRRRIAAAWLVLFAVGIVVGGQTFGRLTADVDGSSDAESVIAHERLEELGSRGPDILGVVDGVRVHDAATARIIGAGAKAVAEIDGVAQVADHYSTGSPLLASKDGHATILAVYLEEDLGAERHHTVHKVKAELQRIDAGTVLVGGQALLNEEFHVQSEKDLQRGEMASLPVVLVVLVIIFGGIVGAGLPLVVALASVAGALLLLFGMTTLTDVSFYAINVATMLGLGLAVDYSLLVITRFREERANGADIPAAVEKTVSTAGHTVAFSGLTVAAALTGLMFFDDPGMKSLAYGGIGVVAAAMAASLTLLPALLGMWGRRIKVKQPKAGSERGVFFRLSRFVQRRAAIIVTVVSVGLLMLATPFLRAELASPGVEALPRSSESRQVFDVLSSRFDSHGTDPITVVAETSQSDPAVAAFVDRIGRIPGAEMVTIREELSGATVIDVVPGGTSQGKTARAVAAEVREVDTPFDKLVGGTAAFLIDYQGSLKERLPFALGAIALATFVLLFLMTGSVIVPVKAMILNLLSLGASFGALVWGFQEGHLAGILNFDASGSIDMWIPIIVFVFAFGLSMDYEVFLLSRIKEEYDRSGDNDHAVAVGLQKTGRIVTSAAILIVIVFLGFATGELVTIKALGVGMALAIIVDASIVRMFLVPALMKLMGDRNWWAPKPLRQLHHRFGLHESSGATLPSRMPAMQEAG